MLHAKVMQQVRPLRRRRRAAAAVLVAVTLCAHAAPAWCAGMSDAAPPAPESDSFVAGFEDLPLMPGLVQVSDAGFVFDTPSGRIVESFAEGRVSIDAIRGFYARTLPQLGWRQTGRDRFEREDEVLDVEVTPDRPAPGELVSVHFYLAPRGAGLN
jgi:hypothetical protein